MMVLFLISCVFAAVPVLNCQELGNSERFSGLNEKSNSDSELDSFFNGSPSLIPRRVDVARLRISESCLACICAASTDCDLSMGCVGQGKYCGPFLISRPYWTDAGSPVILGDSSDRPEAFHDCATDPICAAQTVRKYMTKFQKDCTGDDFVSCGDLALVHLLGPFGSECGNASGQKSTYFQKFQTCWNSVLRLSPTKSSLESVNNISLDGGALDSNG